MCCRIVIYGYISENWKQIFTGGVGGARDLIKETPFEIESFPF